MSSPPPLDPWPLPELTRARRAIVVVDVVESVRLMQEDEAGFIDRWRRFVHDVRTTVLPEHGGRMVKSLGDGMLLEFEHVPRANAAALEMRARAQTIAEGAPGHCRFELRMGMHECDIVADELNVYGSGVNVAARLAGTGSAGELIASVDVRDALVADIDAAVEDMGHCYLKHLEQPVRAFRLHPPQRAPARAGTAAAGVASPLRMVIAVLPFAGTDDLPARTFREALVDDVTAGLSRSKDIDVISPMSAKAFRDHPPVAPVAGLHLGAAYLVRGSCFVDGDRAHVRVQLLEADTERIVWADAFSASLRETLFGEGAVAASVVEAVSVALLDNHCDRVERQPLATVEAYALLHGSVRLMHRCSRADFERAALCLEHLAERHPRVAEPHAYLAKWHIMRVTQGWSDNGPAEGARAHDRSRRALDANPSSALALAIDGLVTAHVKKDLGAARDRYELALSVNPNEALARLFIAALHSYSGDGQAAAACAEHALRLSPLDPLKFYFNTYAGTALLAADLYDRVVELSNAALRHNRYHTPTYRNLAIAQVLAGQVDDARLTVQRMLKVDPHFTVGLFRQRYPGIHTPRGALYVQALEEAGTPT